jgi:mono/diheme cytochrome c family protein
LANEPPSAAAAREAAYSTIRQRFNQEIRPLLERSCFACHDSRSKPEGFLGYVPGVRAYERKHIRDATRILDFKNEFPAWSPQSGAEPVFFLNQIHNVLLKGLMPPKDFKLAHRLDGRLLQPREEKTILDWAEDSKRLLAEADAYRPLSAGKVFGQHCLGCHGEKTGFGGFVLREANGLFTSTGSSSAGIPFVSPGDPGNSAVYLVLRSDTAKSKGLPPMPMGGDPLSDQERDVLFDWIKQSR